MAPTRRPHGSIRRQVVLARMLATPAYQRTAPAPATSFPNRVPVHWPKMRSDGTKRSQVVFMNGNRNCHPAVQLRRHRSRLRCLSGG